MPSFAPRNEPRKKKEELELKKQVLENAISNNLGLEKITKLAENYRTARVLYNKAILHVIREKEWQNKAHSFDKEKALKEMEVWGNKSVEEIINEIRSDQDKKRK